MIIFVDINILEFIFSHKILKYLCALALFKKFLDL